MEFSISVVRTKEIPTDDISYNVYSINWARSIIGQAVAVALPLINGEANKIKINKLNKL